MYKRKSSKMGQEKEKNEKGKKKKRIRQINKE